jgi:hypothetical protein
MSHATSSTSAPTLDMPAVEYYQDSHSLYRHTMGTHEKYGKLEMLSKDGSQYWVIPPATAFHGSFLGNLKIRKKAVLAADNRWPAEINAAWASDWERAISILQQHIAQA